jgi:muramoyltetrapeptide carboxypeptidase
MAASPHIFMIAPSYPFPPEDLALTVSYFENLGMRVTAPQDLLGPDLLCASDDTIRLSHLKQALTDPSVDVIWLLYGGYGLTPLISGLFAIQKPGKEKLFIGFSDGTALHIFLNQIWNWPSLHGACAVQIAKQKGGAQTTVLTLRIAKEGLQSYKPPALTSFNQPARSMSSLSGNVMGGNLCLLECSLGTNWHLNAKDKILFLEDVGERGYRIDRMLVHLQQARAFEGVKAILLGDFTKGEEPDGVSLVEPVLARFASNIDTPVFRLPGCGHGDKNIPLPFNTPLNFHLVQG